MHLGRRVFTVSLRRHKLALAETKTHFQGESSQFPLREAGRSLSGKLGLEPCIHLLAFDPG